MILQGVVESSLRGESYGGAATFLLQQWYVRDKDKDEDVGM